MRKFIGILLLVFGYCCGCTTLSVTDKTKSWMPDHPSQFSSKSKTVEVVLAYSTDENGRMDLYKSNGENANLEVRYAAELGKGFGFTSVYLRPTDYQTVTDPQKKSPDYILNFEITEQTMEKEGVGSKILRAITFGIVKQRIEKQITYKLSIFPKGSKESASSETLTAEYAYQAPLLIIPFDLDHHPFTIEEQIEVHLKALLELTKRNFN